MYVNSFSSSVHDNSRNLPLSFTALEGHRLRRSPAMGAPKSLLSSPRVVQSCPRLSSLASQNRFVLSGNPEGHGVRESRLHALSAGDPSMVRLVGPGESMGHPAGLDPVPWDFRMAADTAGWDQEDAFWMMWFAQRAFAADPAVSEAELQALGFDQIQWVAQPSTGLQAFIARHPEHGIVLSFRGTVDFNGWCTDLNFRLTAFEEDVGSGQVHQGFKEALESGWSDIQTILERMTPDRALPVWTTGHSLGGALATLAGLRLKSQGYLMAPLYTFGAPPVGDSQFCDRMDQAFSNRYFRVTIDEDVVPRALVDQMTWNDISPKIPTILRPLISTVQQLAPVAKFSQGGRLMDIKAPDKLVTTLPRAPRSPAASRHDMRVFWQRIGNENYDVWQVLANQGRCHHNQAYLASLSQSVKPASVPRSP